MSYENHSSRGRAPSDDEADLRAALDAENVQARRDAAVGLVDAAETGLDDATVSALIERIERDPDDDVRQFAVEALGAAGRGIEGIEAALADADPWVRAEGVVAHSKARPGDAETLRDALEDESGWVRRNAVIALGKCGGATQAELIDRIKNDPHPPVREYAAQFLRANPEDVSEAVRILAAVLAREPNAFVRAKAAESLGELGTDRAEEALQTQGLGDRSENVQRTAKRAIAVARGKDPDAVDTPDERPPGGGPEEPVDGAAAVGVPTGDIDAESDGHGRPAPRGPDAGTHGGDRR